MRALLVEDELALAEVIIGAGQALFHHQAQGRLTASNLALDEQLGATQQRGTSR
jgi:hypothetical protein